MRLATFNVNGVNGRLENLLDWLQETQPDIACLQELKAPHDRFPSAALEQIGYGAVWHGQKSWNGVAILSRGVAPKLVRRGLAGDPDDTHSRYIEAEAHRLTIGCLYLPNGNPWPGPKFEYKLRWFERLHRHAAWLIKDPGPVALVGDFNAMPTDFDVYAPERWRGDALFRIEVRQPFAKLICQGWTDAIRKLYPDKRMYTFWNYWRNAFARDAGLRIDHLLLNPAAAKCLKTTGVDRNIRARPHRSDHAPVWVEFASRVQRGRKDCGNLNFF